MARDTFFGGNVGSEPYELRGTYEARVRQAEQTLALAQAQIAALQTTHGHALARNWPNDTVHQAEFSHDGRGNAAGDYSFLSNDGGYTYINGKTGTGVALRINNNDAMTVDGNRALHGSWGGATIAEVTGQNAYYDTGVGGSPNWCIQAGTVVGNFSGGNCSFNWAVNFNRGINSVVVCEGGGSNGWIAGTQNANTTGFGVYLASHAGTLASGLFRINYFALGY